MSDATRVIDGAARSGGYRVAFERREGALFRGDYFPERDEPTIPTIGEADRLAEDFHRSSGNDCVNIAVVGAADFKPVGGEGRGVWRPCRPGG